jgi:hypothetical protein
MSLLDSLTGILSQYASGAAPAGDPGTHFEHVAQSADPNTVAQGIAAALRSDQTPPFAQLASQLFASGSSDQRVAMLETLLGSLPADQRARLSAVIPGFAGGASVTSAQAAAISPDALQTIAQQVEQHDGGIVEKMSAIYAAHPTLVKTLGSVAMMIAMRKIAERHLGA